MSVEKAGLYPDGTGGWSGSSTSHRRAKAEEDSGVRGKRSRQVFALVTKAGASGLTDPEVQGLLAIGHGASSGALTRLHRDGFLARLKEERGRNQVYVHPGFVGERETEPYRPNSAFERGKIEAYRDVADILAKAAGQQEEERARVAPAAAPAVEAYIRGQRDALLRGAYLARKARLAINDR